MRFCGCSDDSVFELAKLPLAKRLEGTDPPGMRDILSCKDHLVANLGEEGKKLVEMCVDFLLFNQLHLEFRKKDFLGRGHKDKYIDARNNDAANAATITRLYREVALSAWSALQRRFFCLSDFGGRRLLGQRAAAWLLLRRQTISLSAAD